YQGDLSDPIDIAVDAFVAKLSPDGGDLLYSTYLGGTEREIGTAVDVRHGRAYVVGLTDSVDTGEPTSVDFPTTPNAPRMPPSPDETQAFATKFSTTGSEVVYSLLLGGGSIDYATDLALDDEGNATIVGVTYSEDFPTRHPVLRREIQPEDAFVTRVDAAGSALIYSSHIGGSLEDGASAVDVDGTGRAFVTGFTDSFDFPLREAVQWQHTGEDEAFLVGLTASGRALRFSTYAGALSLSRTPHILQDANGIAARAGAIHLAGTTSWSEWNSGRSFQRDAVTSGADAFAAVLGAVGGVFDHPREVTLRIRNHTSLRGRLTDPLGHLRCVRGQPVDLRLRDRRRWSPLGRVVTDEEGRFRFPMGWDPVGDFRAVASSSIHPHAGRWHRCAATRSKILLHRH
ncbi:MAG TPA: SBBP repeat-containing protein, partial [Actinomycetota bacterium]|nr:SBBP repeat-containing protein [Actinomycetota bacterium]